MLTLSPHQKAALAAQARSQIAEGRLTEARSTFAQLALAEPGNPEIPLHLSRLDYELGDVAACLTHLDRATTLAGAEPALWLTAAGRYRALGRSEQAIAAYETAAKLSPKEIRPQADLAHYLQALGRFDEAEALFRKLIRKHPAQTELYRMFLGTKKLKAGDPLIRQMQKLWAEPRLNEPGRMHLGFALAKAMEDSGARDKVFGYLNKANALQAKAAPFDRDARRAEVDAFLAAQDGDLSPLPGDMALRPVFVCGMPRSGTTLVEQIIARHSQASAGGEMGHALRLAARSFGFQPVDSLSPEALRDWSGQIQRLAARDCGRAQGVVTDKSIQSFLIFGLIHRAMPGARLIVVHRDPRDVALSIYKNFFAPGTHRYANALADIAFAIKEFRRCVAHWKDRLPGVIHEIRYEDLVSDQARHARALVAAAGLDWEDACLDSHNVAGAVQTLSLAQVRQPIHAGRKAAWKAYETELQPFIDAWGDEPWD